MITSTADAALLNAPEDSRRRAARLKATSVRVLRLLARDPYWLVRATVAANPKTPQDVLDVLSQEKHPDVIISVADNRSTAPDTLHRLSKIRDPFVREVIAQNPATEVRTLVRLCRDRVWDVRRAAEFELDCRSNTELLAFLGLDCDDAERLPREWVEDLMAERIHKKR